VRAERQAAGVALEGGLYAGRGQVPQSNVVAVTGCQHLVDRCERHRLDGAPMSREDSLLFAARHLPDFHFLLAITGSEYLAVRAEGQCPNGVAMGSESHPRWDRV